MNEATLMQRPAVLVIEDDESLRTLFRVLLCRRGFVVECAADGREGLERLRVRDYDVIVLDLMMPRTSGFDVLEHFAKSAKALLGRTIVTTGVNERQLQTIDREAVFAVIRKPFDIEVLIDTVASCAARARTTPRSANADDATTAAPAPAPARPGEAMHRRASRKFGAHAPELRTLLRNTAGSPEELQLRRELRRVVGELGTVLETAARVEPDSHVAGGLMRLADTAHDLARVPVRDSRHSH